MASVISATAFLPYMSKRYTKQLLYVVCSQSVWLGTFQSLKLDFCHRRKKDRKEMLWHVMKHFIVPLHYIANSAMQYEVRVAMVHTRFSSLRSGKICMYYYYTMVTVPVLKNNIRNTTIRSFYSRLDQINSVEFCYPFLLFSSIIRSPIQLSPNSNQLKLSSAPAHSISSEEKSHQKTIHRRSQNHTQGSMKEGLFTGTNEIDASLIMGNPGTGLNVYTKIILNVRSTYTSLT